MDQQPSQSAEWRKVPNINKIIERAGLFPFNNPTFCIFVSASTFEITHFAKNNFLFAGVTSISTVAMVTLLLVCCWVLSSETVRKMNKTEDNRVLID